MLDREQVRVEGLRVKPAMQEEQVVGDPEQPKHGEVQRAQVLSGAV